MEVLNPAYFANCNWLIGEKKSGNWSQQENKLFENALAHFDGDTPDRWMRVAGMIPGKTVEEVKSHYQDLEEDVSCIEAGLVPFPGYSSSSFTLDWESGHGFDEMKHAYSIGVKRAGTRLSDHERKKGIPWTEEEHKKFLMGLKKYGKGDWRNISRNFVVTRTPTQVASHAQKYFIRLNSGSKDKRRASIHDITMVAVEDIRPPSPSQSSSTAAPATGENFSLVADSRQPASPDKAQLVQSPYGIQPYGIKLQAHNLNHGNLSDSIIGRHGVLF